MAAMGFSGLDHSRRDQERGKPVAGNEDRDRPKLLRTSQAQTNKISHIGEDEDHGNSPRDEMSDHTGTRAAAVSEEHYYRTTKPSAPDTKKDKVDVSVSSLETKKSVSFNINRRIDSPT